MEDAQAQESQNQRPATRTLVSQEEVEQLVDEQFNQYQQEKEDERRRMELIKFGILAAILLGTVVILALSQPLVFGRIVPSVMGEGQTANTEPDGTSSDTGETSPDGGGEQTPAGEDTTQDPNQGGGAPAATDAPAVEPGAEEPTAVPAQIYVVQAGDTLNSIARRFNTTVDAIIAVNEIQDPDNLLVGTTLDIPQSE